MRWSVAAILVACAIPVGGCGSCCNLAGWHNVKADDSLEPKLEFGPPTVYGGLENDAILVDAISAKGGGKGAFMFITEIPLTIVADTLTLPIPLLFEWVHKTYFESDD